MAAKSRTERQLARAETGAQKNRARQDRGSETLATAHRRPGAAANDAGDRLLEWYDRRRRDLPWRGSRDPYQILVSEFMLQQTRVAAVVEPYQRFVARFPSAQALAAAPPTEVRAMWSGLGYYRRAERLQQVARAIVAGGGLPRDVAALRRLPGVGPYTAAAVASIAFGAVAPALDGNVLRVLARWLREDEVPSRAAARRRLEAAARALLDPARPGDSNQALMELGATVCLPAEPRCGECPLGGDCRGRGEASAFPRRAPSRAKVRERWLVLVVESGERWLLARRADGSGFLAGAWLLPWADARDGEAAALRRAEQCYGVRFELAAGARGSTRHAITFREIAVTVARARVVGALDAVAERGEAGWFTAAELLALPTSSLVGKALRALARAERGASRSAAGP